MRVGRLFALVTLVVGGSAYALPQCNDGIDNDGDGLIDFDPGSEGLLVGADPQCRSLTWNSEASASDLGVLDGSARVDGGIVDDGIPPGETAPDGSPFEHPDGGGTSTGGGGATAPNVSVDPPRQGCDVGGHNAPTLPLLVVLGLGCGLALLSRRTRT